MHARPRPLATAHPVCRGLVLAGCLVAASSAVTPLAGCEGSFKIKRPDIDPAAAAAVGGHIGSVLGGPLGEELGKDAGYLLAVATGAYALKKRGDAKATKALYTPPPNGNASTPH